ncbi:MAG: hypothetical protein R3C18_07250 [Planctomycetaceae bacterium]
MSTNILLSLGNSFSEAFEPTCFESLPSIRSIRALIFPQVDET